MTGVASITGLILAGGQARRMGGQDKGLQLLQGRPLVEHVIERLRPQVGALIISANRNQAVYAAYGVRVVADEVAGFAGPLAGLERGMAVAATDLLATAPCDSPFFPHCLVERLHERMQVCRADIAIARTEARVHPVFSVSRCALLPHLRSYLAGGRRSFQGWYADLHVVEVPFEDEDAFANINTLTELASFEPGQSADC